ncbi:sulfatase-like hydrolase/transferase [Pajaroellobacter abortibovis]|uniref:sulfatase-like hydrolase/transferase n=1 Tax=Pajaroellobacter abortibovis TaxID=1882918 RepID=UPI0012EB1093|nr:sulfatase-like hydrolase/transferase [Pajaroellobacter abortibovis]
MSLNGIPSKALSYLKSAGCVWRAWLFLLMAETLLVLFLASPYFIGIWEMEGVVLYAFPLAALISLPFVPIAVAWAREVQRAPSSLKTRLLLGITSSLVGGSIAYGVSSGRHFAHLELRLLFVITIGGISGGMGGWLLPFLTERFLGSWGFRWAGFFLAAASWSADRWMLPRLYPSFHHGLLLCTLASVGLVDALRGRPYPKAQESTLQRKCSFSLGIIVWMGFLLLWSPHALRRLTSYDHLRFILAEQAPILGRVAILISREDRSLLQDIPVSDEGSQGGGSRVLDWQGQNIVLITVDALRADHLSSYGYERSTTPSLDALALQGARFEHAYCATPHTSYSIASLMTSKYMRPLIEMGLGTDSETWAGYLRLYGYRTAAFYPPAVFFVDEERFTWLRDRGLDFEYRKVEFASAELRLQQVDDYLKMAEPDHPLFLWVHLFEPHEPYIMHPKHLFGDQLNPRPVDAYDSEIAVSDELIGKMVDRIRADRPNTVFLITADHGEEFGEHGGRYHGSTVYEEQVRVPLLLIGPGIEPQTVFSVVQVIDLLPTVLSALGAPKPARIRGRDISSLLYSSTQNVPERQELGFAFVETEGTALLAQGTARLICHWNVSTCSLYHLERDPNELKDVSSSYPDEFHQLSQRMRFTRRSHGHYEQLPHFLASDAVRLSLQGDKQELEMILHLLKKGDLEQRKRAAEVLFKMHESSVRDKIQTIFEQEPNEEVRQWEALILVRMGSSSSLMARELINHPQLEWRRRAALAFGEQGDPRGKQELIKWWEEVKTKLDTKEAEELSKVFAVLHLKMAVPLLIRALEEVRWRPFIAEALGEIKDQQAAQPLLEIFSKEEYTRARLSEAKALIQLGMSKKMFPPLASFAGLDDPMLEAILFAREAHLLTEDKGGWSYSGPSSQKKKLLQTRLRVDSSLPYHRLFVLLGDPQATLQVSLNHSFLNMEQHGTVWFANVNQLPSVLSIQVEVISSSSIEALWIVPRHSHTIDGASETEVKENAIKEQVSSPHLGMQH